jgi:hypothetical protein
MFNRLINIKMVSRLINIKILSRLIMELYQSTFYVKALSSEQTKL